MQVKRINLGIPGELLQFYTALDELIKPYGHKNLNGAINETLRSYFITVALKHYYVCGDRNLKNALLDLADLYGVSITNESEIVPVMVTPLRTEPVRAVEPASQNVNPRSIEPVKPLPQASVNLSIEDGVDTLNDLLGDLEA